MTNLTSMIRVVSMQHILKKKKQGSPASNKSFGRSLTLQHRLAPRRFGAKEPELEERFKSLSDQLLGLKAQATRLYEQRKYAEAQDLNEAALSLFTEFRALEQGDFSKTDQLSFSAASEEHLQPVAPSNHQTPSILETTNILEIFEECHLNLALCLIRQSLFEDAIGSLTAILHYDP